MAGCSVHVTDLSLRLCNQQLLSIREIECPAGQCTCIVGANGAGKSVFLETLCGHYPYDGVIRFQATGEDERPLCGVDWQPRIGALLQRMNLWPRARVWEILKIVEAKRLKEIQRDAVLRHMEPLIYRNLSSGERQYLFFSLYRDAAVDVLVLDEPLMGLDAVNDEIVLRELSRTDRTSILSFHDFRHVLALADRCYFLCRGSIFPLHLVPLSTLNRQISVEAYATAGSPGADGEVCLLSQRFEVERDSHVELLNRDLIPLIDGLSKTQRNYYLKLGIPKELYEDYRKRRSAIGVA
jgi:ABC-type multidrug transport system ATPase subunit